MTFKRYEIYWVQLDPTRGREMRKTRPAVIVSLDILNNVLATVVVCLLTSQVHPEWGSRLIVKVRGRPAEIAADQIRTVSKNRLGKKLASLSRSDAAALRRLLGEMYGQE